ncbi:MAG: serine/threonine protein kinase [Gemmatimonadetes bacterium]|nr:serine/threonine protein kinase [Gemmatimonadota bacterium]
MCRPAPIVWLPERHAAGCSGPPRALPALELPSMIEPLDRLKDALRDRYAFERELGRGGMATVYLAADLKHHRQVAVKVLNPDLTGSLGARRFLREIETAAKLTHPHILPVFDSGEAEGLLYFVMPYVKGESLRARMERERQLSVEDSVQIAVEIADALAYAHGEGVIHRDVKPANILIESGHAVLADFGVARALWEAKEDRITGTGLSLGTPAYMSPEQSTGSHDLDGRSDQYALGCVLYEMLTGEPPFTGSTPMVVLARHIHERVPSLEVARPNLPFGLVEAVEKSLSKAPADRYRTLEGFRSAVEKGATTEAASIRSRRWRRHWMPWAAAAAVLTVGGAAWVMTVGIRAPPDKNVVMVFPFELSGEATGEEAGRGEDNAYLIWSALEGRGSLGWLNAQQLVEAPEEASRLSASQRRAVASENRAGLYLHGRLMLFGDSARAYLTLHETRRDSVIARADTAGPRSEAGLLGVRAVGKLLLVLLPEEPVDVSAIAGRNPEAIQAFVEGERDFYAGKFQEAFVRYSEAVGQDSAFALAAAKGAQAASWLHDAEAAEDLIGLALLHPESLNPQRYHFARGLESFLDAQADSAVRHFEAAIALDRDWTEAWTGLGEVYTHLLPRRPPQDSLAKAAFARVYELSNHSAPALFHLVEFFIRDREMDRASTLLQEYRETDPDTVGYATRKLALMLRCAEEGPGSIDWRSQTLANVGGVLEAARSLGVGGTYPDCALAGFRAVVAHDTSANAASRYAAAVGLQSMLAATGRVEELRAFLDTTSVYRNSLRPHAIVDALAGVPLDGEAESEAQRLRDGIEDRRDSEVWYVGVWDARRGQPEDAHRLLSLLEARSQGGTQRGPTLMAASLSAHLALAGGDTASALELLDALTPNVRRGSLYYPWESLGLERLLLARLLLEKGRYADAYREASAMDAPGASNLIYPVFLPASLQIRRDASRALGDSRTADRMESRMQALRR